MTTIQNFDDAVQRVAERQRSARRRAWLAVLVPAAVGVAFLAYASRELQNASTQVTALRKEAEGFATQVADLSKEVAERTQIISDLRGELQGLELRLKETTELTRFTHPMDFVDLKMIYSTAPKAAPVLGTIMELRGANVPWSLGGTNPQRGFDSPSFAAFVLQKHGALPSGTVGDDDLLSRSRRLFETLPPADAPRTGDLVFYPAGYALFWFVDQRNRPFVIGMTPSGVIALEPDFAKRVGVRRPQYR